MDEDERLRRADLIELYDAHVAYMGNPGVPSQRNLTRVLVHDLSFAPGEDGALFVRFEREEGVLTRLWYRGHYCVTALQSQEGRA